MLGPGLHALRIAASRWLLPPLFTSLWFTAPRARVCRPRALVRERNRSRSRLGPDAPVRVLVVCLWPSQLLNQRCPGSRQPEQYALEPGVLQIPGEAGLPVVSCGAGPGVSSRRRPRRSRDFHHGPLRRHRRGPGLRRSRNFRPWSLRIRPSHPSGLPGVAGHVAGPPRFGWADRNTRATP